MAPGRVPSTEGLSVGDEFLYCPSCPFQLKPGQTAAPSCPECGVRLRVWAVESGTPMAPVGSRDAVPSQEIVRRINICLECQDMIRTPDGRGEGMPRCGLSGQHLTDFLPLAGSVCKNDKNRKW